MIMATNSVLSSEDCIDGLKSSLSGLSSSDGEIQSALDSAKSQIGACFSGITSCANALTNIKTIADYCLDEEEFSSTLSSVSNIITQGTLKHTTLNCGQSGFLYVPNGETKGKALVTWLDPSEVGLEKNGLGGLISNGYNPAAVVWIPVRNAGQAFGGWYHRNPDGTFPFLDKTAEAVAELQNKFDLDKNRNVLAGFSNGAYGASMLAATHPNMFSRVIIIGGCAHDDRDIQVPLQNAGKDTSWVFIEIKGEVAESASSLAYQQIRESGGQAIKYQVVNDTGGALLHGHGANFINANIIDDAINYRKGTYINGWSENNNSGYSVTQLNNSQSLGYTANDLKKYYESQYITVRYSTIINGYDHRTENSVENNWYINSNYSGTGVTEQISHKLICKLFV